MTEDRKIPAMPLRPDEVVRPGLAHCKRSILAILCLLSFVLCPLATAEGISVVKAEIRPIEEGYQLTASYDINLNFVVKQALSRGIPIYFVGEFSLTHARWDWLDSAQQALSRLFSGESPPARWSWLDKEIYSGEQSFKLSYSTLTGRYRISRGALFQNFASLEDALNILARQSSTVIPAAMIKTDDNYVASARLRLDIAELPKPLQVNALTDSDWTLDSDWYRWVIDPPAIAVHNDGKTE
jgi:Domain of unknown function (DUF4390)